MDPMSFPIQLAPGTLYQPILPYGHFSFFSVNLGRSTNAAFEHDALHKVGSYGRQLGHLAEALEVVIRRLDLLSQQDLPKDERKALDEFLKDVDAIRSLKCSYR